MQNNAALALNVLHMEKNWTARTIERVGKEIEGDMEMIVERVVGDIGREFT